MDNARKVENLARILANAAEKELAGELCDYILDKKLCEGIPCRDCMFYRDPRMAYIAGELKNSLPKIKVRQILLPTKENQI
jgi:hypothetical protein